MQIDRMIRLLAIAAVMVASVTTTPIQAQDPYRVRATLVAVALPSFTVETLSGDGLELTLGEASEIYSVTPGAIDDIDEGQFVGITSVGAAGDRRIALELHIFREDLRGLGEGHYPWDLVNEPNMMTNATIAEITGVEGGPLLTLTYAEGEGDEKNQREQVIQVPHDIPIVHLAKSDAAILATGKEVFLFVQDDEAGNTNTLAVVVGEGIRPPM